MCKQWWKVCFLLNSSQQAQEKYYRQLYGKQRPQTKGEPPSIKTAAATKIQKIKEDANFKPIKNIYSKLFVKTGDADKCSPSQNQGFPNYDADLTLGSTSVVSAHNDVGLYDISDLFTRNPNFYDDIGVPYPKSYEARGCENYENVSNYEHVDDYYDLLQVKRTLNPQQLPKKKYSINVYNLENSRLPDTGRSHDDADLPQLPTCSSNYNNSSLPRNFLSTNFQKEPRPQVNGRNGQMEDKITDPSQLLRNLKENLYSIEQQYRDEDNEDSFPTNSPNLTNLQIDILRNSPLLYEEKPRSRTLDLSRPLSKIYEDPQQAIESKKKDASLKRQSKKVNFNLHVNYEKPKMLENSPVGEINGIIRKSASHNESDVQGQTFENIYGSVQSQMVENIYGSTNDSQPQKIENSSGTANDVSESQIEGNVDSDTKNEEDLYESNISMNLMKISDYNDDTGRLLYESDYPSPADLFTNTAETPFNSPQVTFRDSARSDAETPECVRAYSTSRAVLPSENIYDTLDNVKVSSAQTLGLPPSQAFGLYATTNISNLANPGLYLKSTNVDTLSSEYILPPVKQTGLQCDKEGPLSPCAGFCASVEDG